ncbi:hypothetical protein EZS27_021627 [termite gut metagenome]|uniref:Uncharacterized protein n=1 Tax=termite gut metagenome TaxID=433724 RepID=A0A5J4R8E7_9ZZZZ
MEAYPCCWNKQCKAVMSLKPIIHLGCLRKRVKSSLSIKCTTPYPPRLQNMAFMSSSSIAAWKSAVRCSIVPAYCPDELRAYLLKTGINPQEENRFSAPFKKDLSILLEGDKIAILSPLFRK